MPEKEIELDGNNVSPVENEVEMAPVGAVAPGEQHATFNAVPSDISARLADKHSASDLLDEIIRANETDLIPWEEIPLPSRGLWYNDQIPGGIVRVKAMGAFADKILATQRLAQTGQSIDYLLEHCVQFTNGFKSEDLLAGDRVFLLYVLRGITHGNIYEFLLTCPACEAVNSHTYDLNELSRTLTLGNPNLGSEPFKVSLPYLSEASKRDVYVRVRFLRGSDISTIAKRQRFKKKIAPSAPRTGAATSRSSQSVVIDDSLTENLNLVITDWMGQVTDPSKIKALVERLHSSDTAAIREFLRENSPGIDTTISCSCPNCGNEYKTELPITENFFRPTQRRRV